MFDKEIYVERRRMLKQRLGSGVLLFLGNDEVGCGFIKNKQKKPPSEPTKPKE